MVLAGILKCVDSLLMAGRPYWFGKTCQLNECNVAVSSFWRTLKGLSDHVGDVIKESTGASSLCALNNFKWPLSL